MAAKQREELSQAKRDSEPWAENDANMGQKQQELEIMLSDMELRVRSSVLKVVRPALVQTAAVSGRMDDLEHELKKMEGYSYEIEKVRQDLSQCLTINKQTANLQKDFEARTAEFQEKVQEQLDNLRTESLGAYDKISSAEEAIRKNAVSIGAVDLVTHDLREEISAKKLETVAIIDTLKKKMGEEKEEMLERFREVDGKRVALEEKLFSEGNGMAIMRAEIDALQRRAKPVPEMERTLEDGIARLEVLEKDQVEASRLSAESVECTAALKADKEAYEKRLHDTTREEVNKLLAHVASHMSSLRQEVKAELQGAAQMSNDFSRIQDICQLGFEELSEKLISQTKRVDALHEEIMRDMEDVHRKRKKDIMMFEDEIKGAKHEVESGRQECVKAVEGTQHLARIMGLSLQSELVTSALLVQDFADRKAERWLSTSSHATDRQAEKPCQATSLVRQGDGSAREVVPLPPREVLVHGDYLPGRVMVGGAVFERKDILLLQHKLLERAQAALRSGPSEEPEGAPPAKEHASPAAAKHAAAAARRERGADAAASPKRAKDIDLGQQREGSSMQPEARGNRSSVHLSPPSSKWHSPPHPLKLPEVGNMSGGGGMLGAKSLTAR